MELISCRKEIKGDLVRLIGRVSREQLNDTVDIWFEFPIDYEAMINESADVFVGILLIAAMHAGESLKVRESVSARIIENVGLIQDIMSVWNPGVMTRVETHFNVREGVPFKVGGGVMAFFSCGVDSFYTLLKSIRNIGRTEPKISHIVYMKGFEVPLELDHGSDDTLSQVQLIAEEAEVDLIYGRTNVRSVFPLDWGRYLCGAGLAGCGLALGRGFGHVLIPASVSLGGDMWMPIGSSPLLDPLFGTEYTRIWYAGGECSRVEKIVQLVGRDPLSLKYLRACVENKGGYYNCGKCLKCFNIMMVLKLMGMLDLAKTYFHDFDYSSIDKMYVSDESDLYEIHKCYEISKKMNSEPIITRKLKFFLKKHEVLFGFRLLFGKKIYEKIYNNYQYLKALVVNIKRVKTWGRKKK